MAMYGKRQTEEATNAATKAWDRKMLVVLWGFAKPFFKLLLAAFVIMLLGTGADLIRPYLLKVAIDEQVVTHNVDGLIQTAQLYGSTIVISIILSYGQTLLLQYIGQQIIFDIRQKVFYQLLYQRYSQLETQPVGKMVTRVTNDTDAIKDLYTDVLISFISDFIMIMGIIVVMVLMDWQLALVSFTVIPVMIVVAIAYQKYARSAYRLVREKTSSLNTFIQENLNGIKIVKAFARFKQTEGEYQHVSDEYLSAGLKEMRTYAIFRPLVDLVYSLAIILVLWFSNWQIASGLEIGVVVAFLRYVEKFFWPIKDLAEKYSLLQSALAAAERIWDLISAEKLQEEPQDVSAGQQFKGEIRFEHVWFAYEQEQWVLQDVSLVIPAGQFIGIAGLSGSGKTTLLQLLLRFYEPQQGTIYVDGMDVRTIPVELLRSRIGAVFQEVHLFKGTIADNISLYNKAIANDRIIMAARTANIHDTIINMPQGYDTPVGYQGALLSMGQRQLLSFARAVAAGTDILALDEATSSIDSETEGMIQNALEKIASQQTIVVVAHRLSTIQQADRIFVMHKGKIAEQGTHLELLAQQGLYSRLYNYQ
ncbi:ATP-binding cassette subfamily B protein [Anaerospora hongkongensis]|uniref:ATP-binding cassette subfamily B protein n=1 Tax=Anaerospora hongkongensis TaxID=244830 RepID=A0A4R1PWB0_9FIRM|nr:ABC transporter ATP-binding protein [Anaerospora hongkongensis]TCL32470.1 ATP-binding cassette subfamily B protein [Anaerospora hongkongensis]